VDGRKPQKAHPWPELLLRVNFDTDPSTGAVMLNYAGDSGDGITGVTCARDEGIKRKEN